ncbi:MAG TPA: xanthine dehydrogenase small subunit [Caldimonas sp.]|jgi:xanthine dehydrogenase small subunit|nr:xanthine dehydrogenase small subunit [Caldimonas sp.]HEX2539924.1 xanthine dehydrogenase small subunit [Caldimonas sp.]
MAMSSPIRFFHRGAVVEVDGASPTRTVLEWLREDARCTGTKEGCNEGDCGACTVVVGELPAPGAPHAHDFVGGLRLRPVNACIRFLPTLDGKALFSVEDVGRPERLHPVQQAMVECHGSQCGFCTPGFVMSLWATYEQHRATGTQPTRQQLADALSGNLCRCTGYRPILDAGERMFELPAEPLATEPIVQALEALRRAEPFVYAARGGSYEAPRTLARLAAARLARPEARLLAGSTDIGLWVTKMLRELPSLIFTGEVAELSRVDVAGGTMTIGAAVSLEDAYAALVTRFPALREIWLRFASVPVRNAGTLVGNVANGSPIGDSAPVLMALDARVVLRRGDRVRTLPLDGFYTGYMQNRLEAGEFVQAVEVPLDEEAPLLRAYKISKRFDSDISAVCAALAIRLEGDVARTVRLAFGGMAATVKRAAGAEAALTRQPWNEATLTAAQLALVSDFVPLTDMRASAAYRMQVAQNLLRRFWLETRPTAPLAADAVSVWEARA